MILTRERSGTHLHPGRIICLLFGLLVLAAPAHAGEPWIQIVETVPVETELGFDDVADAYEVWPEMIRGAQTRLELAGFYFSNHPEWRESNRGDADLEAPRYRFELVLREILAAAERGVRVRVLADAGFHETYPATLDRLAQTDGIEVRLIDFRALAGGPLHAKYFLVDERTSYVGSQNFDWRALAHIRETGMRIDLPGYAQVLGQVFEMDWEQAEPIGDPKPSPYPSHRGVRSVPFERVSSAGDTLRVWPALSPTGFLPDEEHWDLPRIEGLLDSAKVSIQVTCLSYTPKGRDGTYWEVLDNALRRAAVQGVTVRLMVSDWSKRAPKIDFLKSLQMVPGIEVKLVTIPEASEGFIPFARVIHSKFLTVDGRHCWLGTTNWEKSYFFNSRNVGLVIENGPITGELDRSFDQLWNSAYAEPVRPEREYTPPRIGG